MAAGRGQAISDYLSHQAQRFDALASAAFADGVAQVREEHNLPEQPVNHAQREALLARLRRFYQPHLLRYVRDLYGMVARAGARPDPALINQWFVANGWRLTGALDGLVWSAAEAGYAYSAGQADLSVAWVEDKESDHCWMCEAFAQGSPYTGWQSLPAIPGDGTTPCGSNCHCILRVRNRTVVTAQGDISH